MIILNTIHVPVQLSVTSFSFKIQFLGYSIDSHTHGTRNVDLACSYSLNLPSVSKKFLLPTSLLLKNMPLMKSLETMSDITILLGSRNSSEALQTDNEFIIHPQLGSYLNYTRFNLLSSVISPPHIRSFLQKTSECFILWKI